MEAPGCSSARSAASKRESTSRLDDAFEIEEIELAACRVKRPTGSRRRRSTMASVFDLVRQARRVRRQIDAGDLEEANARSCLRFSRRDGARPGEQRRPQDVAVGLERIAQPNNCARSTAWRTNDASLSRSSGAASSSPIRDVGDRLAIAPAPIRTSRTDRCEDVARIARDRRRLADRQRLGSVS